MEKSNVPSISEAVIKALKKEKSRYMNIKALITGFPMEIKQLLGFSKNLKARDFTAKEAWNRINSHLDNRVMVYSKGHLIYLSLDSKDKMILRKLSQAKSFPTFKMLRRSVLPLVNEVFTQELNSLLLSGKIKCTFKGDNPVLSISEPIINKDLEPDENQKTVIEKDTDSPDDPRSFKAVLEAVGKGRRLVYIYQIRRSLDWPRERFDKMIRQLRGQYLIQLHGGDPSVMTEDQVRDSFMDEKGVLHISVSWRGN